MGSIEKPVYTASFAFFEALWEVYPSTYPREAVKLTHVQAGITHVFVNLGSDHPSIIEAIVKGQNEKKGEFPKIITCPNEVCCAGIKGSIKTDEGIDGGLEHG